MGKSGKKRKAAMKKKQKVATTSSNVSSSTTDSHGDEDLKHHESEGDLNSENNFSEGEEEGVVEKIGVDQSESVVDEKNGSEGVEKGVGEDEDVVQIEGESKLDEGSDNKNGSSSSGSSSSSSDDESHDVENDIVILENAPVVDIVEAVDSLSEGPTHTTPAAEISDSIEEAAIGFDAEKVSLLDEKLPVHSSASAENSLVSEVVVSEPKENEEKKLNSLEDSARLVEVLKDLAPELKKDEVTAENSLVSEDVESVTIENEEKKLNLLEDGDTLVEVVKDIASEHKDISTAENSLVSEVVESVVTENEEKKLNALEDSARLVEVVKDLAPEHKKDEVTSAVAASDEVTNAAAASDVKESAAALDVMESVAALDVKESAIASDVKESVAASDVKESVAASDVKESAEHAGEEKPIPPYDAPTDDAIKNGEHAKDSGVLGASEAQPLVSSVPRQVQTTSWKSCCGLFEALAGSNR